MRGERVAEAAVGSEGERAVMGGGGSGWRQEAIGVGTTQEAAITVKRGVPLWGGRYEGVVPLWGVRCEGVVPQWGVRCEGVVPLWGVRCKGVMPLWGVRCEGVVPLWGGRY